MSSEFTQDVVFSILFSHNCSMLVQSRLEITTPSGHLEHVTSEAMHCIRMPLHQQLDFLPTNLHVQACHVKHAHILQPIGVTPGNAVDTCIPTFSRGPCRVLHLHLLIHISSETQLINSHIGTKDIMAWQTEKRVRDLYNSRG